ncbi:MAG: helix-turn-helix domain-containing protein [Gemmatimonadota bacterium]|nr:helix-turn-helix domain-containing protein [Gemmatimonadota bacterium]
MDQFEAKTELTSSEAAALLDVHPSTVKRWCNDGELDSEQTPGGHRRIRIDAAVRFAEEHGTRTVLSPFHTFEAQVWTALRAVEEEHSFRQLHDLALHWARGGAFEHLEQLYLALGRAEYVSFCVFCDEAVRGLMGEVGAEWQRGRLRVGDEHMVSQAIHAALITLRREWLDRRRDPTTSGETRPVAVVGTMMGNHHQLGALCVRLLLERCGWEVYYPGHDVPIEDFAEIQRAREATLVCISLGPAGTIGDVTRSLTLMSEFYDRGRPYSIVFGGAANLDVVEVTHEGLFESVAFLDECRTLREALEAGLGALRSAS